MRFARTAINFRIHVYIGSYRYARSVCMTGRVMVLGIYEAVGNSRAVSDPICRVYVNTIFGVMN